MESHLYNNPVERSYARAHEQGRSKQGKKVKLVVFLQEK